MNDCYIEIQVMMNKDYSNLKDFKDTKSKIKIKIINTMKILNMITKQIAKMINKDIMTKKYLIFDQV